jgi:hypothetical protein
MSTTKTIPVEKVTLFELQQRFNLQQVDSKDLETSSRDRRG